MQRNKVHHVYTVERVARDFNVSQELIHDLTLGLEPEDGIIWIYGTDDNSAILAFTDEGIEEVELLLEEYHRASSAKAYPSGGGRLAWIGFELETCGFKASLKVG